MQKTSLITVCIGSLTLAIAYLNHETKEGMQEASHNYANYPSNEYNSFNNDPFRLNTPTDNFGTGNANTYYTEDILPTNSSYSLEHAADHIPLSLNGKVKSAIIMPRKKRANDTLQHQSDTLKAASPIVVDSIKTTTK